jgi:ribosomal protein S18 acetylase RimI-like enzyme
VQEALITWAEQHLRQSKPEGGSWLEVHCLDYDLIRKQILRGHGFAPLPEFESIRSRRMVERVPQLPLPAGFKFASAGRRDGERMAMLLNAAFARTTHSAEEWVNFCAYAPSFRSDLQVVVIAPDDSFAAHAGLTVHTDQGFATIEPVCTHPVYQNRGLAKAAISEALRRTQNLGVSTVYVSAWHSNPVSNHVYDAMGFGEPRNLRIWRREFED